jgi:hypothetical protein
MNHCAIARENTTAPTWQPEHRLACEAAMLLRMPLVQRRMELAVPARAKRRQALEVEMRRQFDVAKRVA